jgi:hypothetical protein
MDFAGALYDQVLAAANTPMKLLILLFLSLALTTEAQSDFRAFPGTETMIEGGRVDKLTVIIGTLQFNIRPPRNWSCQIDAASRKITYTSPSGRSAILVQFTSASPGKLQDDDVLRAQALQEHPGTGIVQSSVCPTGIQPGLFVDLVAVPAPGVLLKIRHAFVAQPAGQTEFVLSASNDEFDQYKLVLMGMLRAFRVQSVNPKPS